jgi:RNA polymerase sigma factor (sigma-70 family)
MEEFEQLLRQHYRPLERYVNFRMDGTGDGDDLLQEVCLAAYEKFHTLRDREKFKSWVMQIAQNKIRDYYRRRRPDQVPLETAEPYLTASRYGPVEAVRETMERLGDQDRMLLEMTYFGDMTQAEIADTLKIPLGTVKSRLFAAKSRFRAAYPQPKKGAFPMKELPKIMPKYSITPVQEPPFSVKWEEIQGWFLVPRVGNRLRWAMYEQPTGRRTMSVEMEATGKAQVHGVEGVEVRALEYDPVPSEQANAQDPVERRLVAQLTDTHCRILAESHVQDGVRRYYTFLDGDDFLQNWGFGPDNCGNPINIQPSGILRRDGDAVTMAETAWPMDVVGRYQVELGGRTYDTICVLDVECYDGGVATETYLDKNGRTILWRRFNRDDWAYDHFRQPWTEKLPSSPRLTINGTTYVHWYDCITDYIL